ncbi:MAG: hypothetical protein AB7D06_08780 [Pedobacter sp.]
MLEKFLNRLIELKRPETVEIDGRQYTTAKLYPVEDPTPAAITVHTLASLATYIKDHPADLPPVDQLILSVDSPVRVDLLSHGAGYFNQRRHCAAATVLPDEFPFGCYMPQEEFVIAMMTRFVRDKMVDDIMAVAGNLSADTNLAIEDDGVSQRLNVKAGISRKSEVVVENPVTLRPYRTFIEVEQPECQLVLRFKKDREGVPQCALFEADGGLWKNKAADNIATWLRQNVPGVSVLA